MKHWSVFLLFYVSLSIQAGEYFHIELQELSIPGLPAIHSAAIISYEGKWIIIGGRTNGLHGFNAIDPFSQSGINTLIYVIDASDFTVRSASAHTLPQPIFEAVTTSNMQFYRHDSTLYLIGGYGWNDSAQTFLTARTLTAVNLRELIAAIENQQTNITPFFRQYYDTRLAICGAHMAKIDDTYFLIFGHLFDGTYSRSDTSGLFVQQYSREIRTFKIIDDGTTLSIADYSAWHDTLHFRRRDYNLVPQIFPDGRFGYTAFSGVFLKDINLPYLNPIDIYDTGYHIHQSFHQHLSHYHSAVMAVYDSASKEMHSVFFGGMALYYRDAISHTLVVDSLVPFVNTVSMVSRDSMGNMSEYELNIKMPGLLGTNAQFLLNDNVPLAGRDIIHLNQIFPRLEVGYVYGGIESPEINISETDPSMSNATNRLFRVTISKLPPDTTLTPVFYQVKEPIYVKIYPNPFYDNFTIELHNFSTHPVRLTLYDYTLSLVKKPVTIEAVTLKKTYSLKQGEAGIYFLEVKSGQYKKYYRVVKL